MGHSHAERVGRGYSNPANEALAARPGRVQRRMGWSATEDAPIEERLDADREYREKAAAGRLRQIIPWRLPYWPPCLFGLG